MNKRSKKSDKLFINRELSWLEFNDRVLREGLSKEIPVLERIKFLAITSSNLDESFMIRVAGLMQQRAAKLRVRDPSGMTPTQQLAAYSKRAHRMVEEQTAGTASALEELEKEGIHILGPDAWNQDQQEYLRNYFSREILPVLTPLAVDRLKPCPLLPDLRLHIGAVLQADTTGVQTASTPASKKTKQNKKKAPKRKTAKKTDKEDTEKIVTVPVPDTFPRFLSVTEENRTTLVRIEEVIRANLDLVFPGYHVLATTVFRLTRDANVTVEEDEASDLLREIEEAIRDRRRRQVVRLEIAANPDSRIKRWLKNEYSLRTEEIYEIDGMLDLNSLGELVDLTGFEHLKSPQWPPCTPRDLVNREDIWQTLRDGDVLLNHPYESFDAVVQLVEEAATSPEVLSIKQTLYRTSGDSPIVRALAEAARNGKEVTALVELTARFDESRNIAWARRLEDAGCHVIYGIAGYKTHSKALLIVRREAHRIRRYVHLATGNYNDKTARTYSDLGLMTSDPEITGDVAAFFNVLTGYSEMIGWSKLAVAPTGLRQRLLELIDREIQISTPEEPGLIMAKMNSLEDPEICEAIARASQSNVQVQLNVRGVCCLRPGVQGLTDHVEVTSIIDRFLEHARIFYFRNGGHEETYMASADWMYRNLSERFELMFPVSAPKLRRRLIEMLKTYFNDNVKASRLLPDGTYEKVQRRGRKIRAQEILYKKAVEAARISDQTTRQFRPLTRPDA
ncbi:MAG: polyphosphate kinase 1 [Planctomycetia bacterium]|jgi:polyphosphate kinase